MALAAFEVDDEADAAGIMLFQRIVQALRGRKLAHRRSSRSESARRRRLESPTPGAALLLGCARFYGTTPGYIGATDTTAAPNRALCPARRTTPGTVPGREANRGGDRERVA